MQGKVKWFSHDKGYGFIVDEQGGDHYFGVRDIKGSELPDNGDSVSFDIGKGKKGPKAIHVHISNKSTKSSKHKDDRVTCSNCGRKIVPRIITGPPLVKPQGGWTPVPKKSICPYCATTYEKFPPSIGEIIGLIIFICFILIFLSIFGLLF